MYIRNCAFTDKVTTRVRGECADKTVKKILQGAVFDCHRVALLKAARGFTTFDELQRVVPITDTPFETTS